MIPLPVSPPVTSTRPSPSSVAVCPERGEFIAAATEKTPLVPNRSALADGPEAFAPPAIRTLPSCSKTAAAPERTSPMGFQVCQEPAGTLGTDAVRQKTQRTMIADVVRNLLRAGTVSSPETEISLNPERAISGLNPTHCLQGRQGRQGETDEADRSECRAVAKRPSFAEN